MERDREATGPSYYPSGGHPHPETSPGAGGAGTLEARATAGADPAVGTGAMGGQPGAPGAGEVVDEARGAVGQVVDEVQRQAAARMSEQINLASGQLSGLATALLSVGRELREQDDAMMAVWTERAAGQVGQLSSYLRGKDLDDIVYEVEGFARRQPALFLGGAFTLGLLAARFLKASSSPHRHADGQRRPYGGAHYDRGYQGTYAPSPPPPMYRQQPVDSGRPGYGAAGGAGMPPGGPPGGAGMTPGGHPGAAHAGAAGSGNPVSGQPAWGAGRVSGDAGTSSPGAGQGTAGSGPERGGSSGMAGGGFGTGSRPTGA